MIKKNYVSFDVMISGGAVFYCTLRMPVQSIRMYTEKDFRAFAIEKRPTLKFTNFLIALNY